MTDFKALSSIYSILILIGGLIGVLAVFLAWIDINGIFISYTWSGWEIIRESINNPALGDISDSYAQWMPLIVLIFSVVGLLIGLTALLKPRKEVGAGAIVCGILVVIAGILFYTYESISNYAGTGIYLAIVAGIVMVIFGALRLFNK